MRAISVSHVVIVVMRNSCFVVVDGLLMRLVADWKPHSPLVHASGCASTGCQGNLNTAVVRALAFTVVIICVGQTCKIVRKSIGW